MEPRSRRSPVGRSQPWIALALCAAVLLSRILEHLVANRPGYARSFAPDWLPLAALALAAAGVVPLDGSRWPRAQRALRWGALLLMLWTANGLPFDLLRLTPLIPLPVDWPGLATRSLALAAAVVLARLALERPAAAASARAPAWYGYAAFVLVLPYPLLRTHWAMGGTLGLGWPGAAGQGWAPWLMSIPFLLAAALSLLLVSPRRWIPRAPLLAAGWTATTLVALVGPAACWTLASALASGRDAGMKGIATWVFGVIYGSWFLWAIAAAAATRSYQLRSAAPRT